MVMSSVSLITICWNGAGTIRRTLDSVLSQRAMPGEYLVVDGGSTDGTQEILNEYLPRFQAAGVEFRVMNQPPHPGQAGIPHAWNLAIPQCRGDVIAILNADDWYVPEALQVVGSHFDEDATLDAVMAPIVFVSGTVNAERLFSPRPLALLPCLMPVPHPGCFFRRRVYEQLGVYDTRYHISADYDFIWRFWKARLHTMFLDEVTTRMQAGGAANSSRALARRETLAIARRYSCALDPRPWCAFLLRCLTGR